MNPKNRYYSRSKISEAKFRELLRFFALDFTASDAARLTGLSARAINDIYLRIRRRLAEECEQASPFEGVVEVDESYFGPHLVPGKRGRGASGKTIVFGLLKRGETVYTQIVSDCRKATLQAAIRGRVALDSVIHSDSLSSYDGLVDVGYAKHWRVRHSQGEYAVGSNHINGIESFWSYAKRRLAKFNGVPNKTFYLHLKECEYRFNHRHRSLYHSLLKLLRERPL
ncbi:IS1595 family transposase [Pseudomonas nitroreducens]|uniref:IS1595 family transposase n=1 Tax=Pseudomonas nitroreducens TaxID=46680 RepID=UPI00244B925F|nr:IS1595 family transposase [Pseudomonas nitroreducens]ELN4703265.1 IS1595 family transposase [Escherichia coli]MDG9853651.1 IS1595 family transposase [Pseudomonas nitroreducens]MDH1076058.1 IS1595 family transposase [Pseudomonas nitroreducens]